MSSLSNEVKELYRTGSHPKRLVVYFPDLDYTVPEDEVYYESFELDEGIFEGDSFEAVGCIASSAVVSIRDFGEELKGERISIWVYLTERPNDSVQHLFYGTVDSVTLEGNKQIRKITAYDDMYKLADVDCAEWYKNLTFPNNLGTIRASFEQNVLGITTNYTLVNDVVTVYRQLEPNTLNALNVLKAFCQINGVFGKYSRESSALEYLNLSDQTVESVTYFKSCEYEEYSVDPVDKVTIRDNSDSVGTSAGSGTNNYIIQGNMWAKGLESSVVYTMASNIVSQLRDFTYIPFTAEQVCYPWIECGKNNIVQYEIYDFNASQQAGYDVYETVTFHVMYRHTKGIQSMCDTFGAKGNKDQTVFISELNDAVSELKDSLETVSRTVSTDFVYYRNPRTVTITDGNTDIVADITYQANKGAVTVIQSEISCVTTADIEVLANYVINGNTLTDKLSEGQLLSGKNLLHLMQFWANGDAQTYRVQIYLSPTGGDISISPQRACSFVTIHEGEVTDFSIEIISEPDKTEYAVGESFDYTGLEVHKVYYDDTIPDEDVTSQCVITPRYDDGGMVVTEPIPFSGQINATVSYSESNDVGERISYKTQFYLSVESNPFDSVNFLVDDENDPYGDGSYQRIDIPYMIFTVDAVNHVFTYTGFKADLMGTEQPANVYIPEVIITRAGTEFHAFLG